MATAKKKTAASASTKSPKGATSATLHGLAPYQAKAKEEYMNDLTARALQINFECMA